MMEQQNELNAKSKDATLQWAIYKYVVLSLFLTQMTPNLILEYLTVSA